MLRRKMFLMMLPRRLLLNNGYGMAFTLFHKAMNLLHAIGCRKLALDGTNDGNGDGIADILTGAGPGGAPQVNVFSFPDLDLLFSYYSGEQSNTGGVFVS